MATSLAMGKDTMKATVNQLIAVFDCMVYLQALARPDGPAAACWRLVEDGRIRLAYSADVLREVRDVLARPKVRAKNPRLTDAAVAEFLTRVAELGVECREVPPRFSSPRDPKDEPYLNLALAAGAAYLVSRDKDLLDLMAADDPAGKSLGRID